MNAFNKFLVVLMTLVGILFWGGAIFVMWFLPEELGAVLRALSGALIQGNPVLVQALVTVFGASVILVSLLVLTGEFTDHEPESIRLPQVSGGSAFVPIASIGQRVKSQVEQEPAARIVRPRIRRVRDGLEVVMDLRVAPDADLGQTAEASCRHVRDVVEQQLGLPLKDVRVNISHDPRARPMAEAARVPVAGERREGEILVPAAAQRPPEPANEPPPPAPPAPQP